MPDNLASTYRKIWETVREKIEGEDFDRFRVLCPDESDKSKETDENEAFKKNIKALLSEVASALFDECKKNGIWLILNYYSLFIKERCKVVCNNEPIFKTQPIKQKEVTWYSLFGSLNTEVNLIVRKKDDAHYIYSGFHNLCLGTDENKIKSSILEVLKRLSLYNEPQEKIQKVINHLKDIDDEKIFKDLCSDKNMSGWEEESLIFSNKYEKIDFSDTVGYYPNILFFKKDGKFDNDEVELCKTLKDLYIDIATYLLIFENEILLDRLEDLVDSKPQRIFRRFTDTDNKGKFIEGVKTVFDGFIEEDLENYHPLIKNDLIIAFYLYWTHYFSQGTANGSFLDIPPWVDVDSTVNDSFSTWSAKYKEQREKINFDFKEFIFEQAGEKSVFEFERKDEKEFKEFVEKKKSCGKEEVKEFRRIVIGNIDYLTEEQGTAYQGYVKDTLEDMLKDMNLQADKCKELKDKIGDGSTPAQYFSLFCKDGIEKTGYKYIYYIPSVNHDGRSYGGFSFLCKSKWPRSITKAAMDWATRFGTTFAEIEVRKIVAKHGTKAAVSAIMSRNMSHNIGSHAISLWNMQLNEQLKGKSDADQGIEPLKSVKDSKDLFQYLQHRMDFIAEVSTSIPGSEMTMNFKNDIMQPFIDQKVLFKNIAASEGIEVTIENKDVVIPKDCERVSIPNGIIGTHAVYSIFENFIRNAAKHYKGTGFKIKVELKIPSSVRLKNKDKNWDNGNYKIVNNILTVKKNSDETTHILTKKEQDEIKNKFNEYADKNILDRFFFIHEHYIEMHIWDMRRNSCDKVSVDDKTTTVVEKLREYLDLEKSGKFIDEEGRLQAGGWGFKEMITSANFLRKNPTDKIIEQMDEKEPPLMQIICGDEGNELACKYNDCHRADEHKNKLGVLFYLRKPKDMLVFGEGLADKITKDKFEIETAHSASWPQKGGKLTKDIPHRLLLVPDDDFKKLYTVDPKAPMRVVKYNNGEINDNLYLSKYKEFINDTENKLNLNGELPKLCYGGGGENFKKCLDNNKNYLKWVKDGRGREKQATPAECVTNKNVILFYHHAEKPDNKETVNSLLTANVYFQPVSGSYSSSTRLKTLPTDKLIQEHFFLELIESALTRILIIDERVSDLADKVAFHEIKNSEIFKNMRIHVLDIDKKNVIKKAIEEKYKSINGNGIHFLVIHQGILDKLEKNQKGSSIELITNIKHRWLVIDSGRGVPPEIEQFKEARFVETSALLKMLETYDKHAFVQTLFALRRPDVD